MGVIKDSLTFDDVTLVPQYSSVLPSEAVTVSKLSNNLNLQIPLMSSAMDTVTESKMAIAISKSGGIGVIHRNFSIEKQAIEVQKVKKSNCLVGAAIGVNPKDLERAEELSKVKTDLIVIDTAHGHTQKVLNMISKIKRKLKYAVQKISKEKQLIDTNFTYVIFGKNNVYKDKFANVLCDVNETFKKINQIGRQL